MELNVFFENPFWVGMFYLDNGDEILVERVVFGSEPKDGEIYHYILYCYQKLCFEAKLTAKKKVEPKNPKRMQRVINKQCLNLEVGTKSMQALKKQYEQRKHENKVHQQKLKENKKDYLFQLKQAKRKAKRKGH